MNIVSIQNILKQILISNNNLDIITKDMALKSYMDIDDTMKSNKLYYQIFNNFFISSIDFGIINGFIQNQDPVGATKHFHSITGVTLGDSREIIRKEFGV